MSQATAYEQLLLELVNAERAKAGVQPLAFNSYLNDSADGHTNWMLATDTFSHTGVNGSTPTQRMTKAGYNFTGSWASAENIAWASTRAPSGYQDEVQLLHTNLMNSSGHKANILNGSFREIGIGFNTGSYQNWDAAFVTENFALSGSKLFLTGVALGDRDGDRFYDVGEGLAGLAIKAVSTTGVTYSTSTQTAGGYSLALTPGTYNVTFSGGGITPVTKQITIGTKNVKFDLVNPASGTLASTTKTISGTAGNNTLSGTASSDVIKGYAGNDRIDGKDGADKIYGGTENDTLIGNLGNDRLYGESGKDVLYGAAGNDVLIGGADADVFRFRGKWGADKVLDFKDGIDHLDLRGNSLSLKALSIAKSDADKDGRVDDVVIKAHDQSITLLNIKASMLSAADFLF